MRCNTTKRHLTAFLDGELDEKLRAGIEKHLGSCAACQSERKALERVRDAIKHMPMPEIAPCASADAILDRARSEKPRFGQVGTRGSGATPSGGHPGGRVTTRNRGGDGTGGDRVCLVDPLSAIDSAPHRSGGLYGGANGVVREPRSDPGPVAPGKAGGRRRSRRGTELSVRREERG